MSTKNKKSGGVNNSSTITVKNFPLVQTTTTKNKVSAKFTLVDDAQQAVNAEKIDKNKLFAEVSDYFCPIKFDSSKLEESLSPLVKSGVLSEDAKAKAIETAKREFFEAHKTEIDASQKLSFAEVVAKLQENETLYKMVLKACNISELSEANYIENGKVLIYRAAQCTDKDGKERYQTAMLKREENGNVFEQPLFVEIREQTTANILLAIRYYSSKQNATKVLLNKVSDFRRLGTNVKEAILKAHNNGFAFDDLANYVPSGLVKAIIKQFAEH